jgi:HSP20 family protein
MPIIPWRPFWDLDKWFEEEWPDTWERPRFGRRFRFPSLRTPRMDISETEKEVISEVELPGVDPKNIDVEVGENILRVQAKTQEKKEEKKKGYYRKEISSGFYKRAVPLPVQVLGDKAQAEYKDGILKVIIPKVSPKKVKKEKTIKIKVKGKKKE